MAACDPSEWLATTRHVPFLVRLVRAEYRENTPESAARPFTVLTNTQCPSTLRQNRNVTTAAPAPCRGLSDPETENFLPLRTTEGTAGWPMRAHGFQSPDCTRHAE